MAINWIKMSDRKPQDNQSCLTKMKYGIIQGTYDEKEDNFGEYYWRSMEWTAYEWAPIEEAKPPEPPKDEKGA